MLVSEHGPVADPGLAPSLLLWRASPPSPFAATTLRTGWLREPGCRRLRSLWSRPASPPADNVSHGAGKHVFGRLPFTGDHQC